MEGESAVDDYARRLLCEGTTTVVDEDTNYIMELPHWADEAKIKIGQKFVLLNANAMVNAMYYGFIAIAAVESIGKALIFTKQSSTPALAYRRFKSNVLHAMLWFQHPIKPESMAWKSLDTVRKMHAVMNRRLTNAGVGIISQKDMAITQFMFVGFQVLMPVEFGVVGSEEQLEAYSHLWRVIGYMLGTADRFNCCGKTLDETRKRLRAIRDEMLLPAMQSPFREYEDYIRIAFDGMWHFDPSLHYGKELPGLEMFILKLHNQTSSLAVERDSLEFLIKRAIRVPGYHFFDSEHKGGLQPVFQRLPLFTKLRVSMEILVYEYLSHIFVFRWAFNTFRAAMLLFVVFPVLALMRFGKKYAHVEIMRQNKKN